MKPISTVGAISTMNTTPFQSNLEVSKSSINVIFIVILLIRLRNVGLKSGLELEDKKE